MDKRLRVTGAALVAIVMLAIGFRFYDIKNYPPGLFPDQAANGEDVLLILEGDARPFYPRGNGREALFFYLQAALVKAVGIGVWPMFAASAIVGTLTVFATFFATRIYFGRLSGLLAAFFLATSYWHVTLSRTGFRAILIPLCVAAFTAFVGYCIAAVKKKQFLAASLYAIAAGATFMAGFYTYIAYRMMVGVLLGMLLLMLLAALHPRVGFPHLRRYRRELIVGILAAVLVAVPLGWYFWQHPADFIGRAGQVSIFSPALQQQYGGGELLPTLTYSIRETLVSFYAGAGDQNWRHSVPGFPLLNPLVGILSLLGIAWCIHGTVMLAYQLFRGEEPHLGFVYPYLLLLLLGMLVPVVTTAEGLPHGLRSVGLIAPLFILAGTAGSVSIYWLRRRLRGHVRAGVLGVVVALLIISGAYDGLLYFGIAQNDAEAYVAYRGDLTTVAQYLNEYHQQHPDAPRPYLVLDGFSLQTVHYLTSVAAHDHVVGEAPHPDVAVHRWQAVDPATSSTVVLSADERMIFTQSTMADADRYKQTHPDVVQLESRTNRWGQEIMRVYSLPKVESTPGGGDLDA